MSKKTFDGTRLSAYGLDPITQICLIGGQNPIFAMPEDEWGELDTDDDDSHPLFDERLGIEVEPEQVDNADEFGIITPIIVTHSEIDGAKVAVCVEGRQRVRWARKVNRRRAKKGLDPIEVPCMVRRSTESGLMEVMLAGNMIGVDESPVTAMAKIRRLMDHGLSIERCAKVSGKSVATLKGWLAYEDNASADVKRAVESGRITQTTGAEIAATAGDVATQNAALAELLANAPEGAKPTRQAAKQAAKQKNAKSKGRDHQELSGKKEQNAFLEFLGRDKLPSNASEYTQGWWDGAAAMLYLVIGGDEVDDKLTGRMMKFAEMKKAKIAEKIAKAKAREAKKVASAKKAAA